MQGDNSDAELTLVAAYKRFYRNHDDSISLLFRFLNQVMTFVNECSLTNKEKYWAMLRDQLKPDLLILIFYHHWVTVDCIELDRLVEKGFFDYLNKNKLLDADLHNSRLTGGTL
ncbi:putative phage abortive infection protein [Reinekea marina]|nr:putative phage abortive infection protein [Reinekea marina]MDN3647573.1 putative phage abortive infection protein [Reinekea marina]